MTKESIAQKITKASLTENTNRRLQYRTGYEDYTATRNEFVCEPKYYYIVSIEDKPVSKERFLRFDSDIKFTKGAYSIQYLPKHHSTRTDKFPYLIGQDLVRLRVTVSGPRHWGCLCKRIPELGWIQRNSTFRDEYFAIAKKHPGLVIKFGVDFSKYCGKIEERAEKEGIDIDHKPLFSYLWNDTVMNELKQVDVSGWQKEKKDYLKELEEVESSSTVLAEIKGNK